MGLIDATKAIESIDEIACSVSVCISSDYRYGMIAMKDAAIHAIEEQQTVDAVPVVHARWYRYSYDEAICTHCGYDRWTGFECSTEANEKWDELPPYCEECGARMDGDRKDGDVNGTES